MRKSNQPSGVKCSTEICPRITTNAELSRSTLLYQKPYCKLCFHFEYYRRKSEKRLDVPDVQIDTLRNKSELKGGEKYEY